MAIICKYIDAESSAEYTDAYVNLVPRLHKVLGEWKAEISVSVYSTKAARVNIKQPVKTFSKHIDYMPGECPIATGYNYLVGLNNIVNPVQD